MNLHEVLLPLTKDTLVFHLVSAAMPPWLIVHILLCFSSPKERRSRGKNQKNATKSSTTRERRSRPGRTWLDWPSSRNRGRKLPRREKSSGKVRRRLGNLVVRDFRFSNLKRCTFTPLPLPVPVPNGSVLFFFTRERS